MLIKYSIVFCVILVVSLASSEESVKIEVDAQDKHFEQKSVSKRGVHSFGTFGHPHGGLHYTDYTLPPAIPFYGKHFAHKPLLVQHQPFQIAHGGADVTSYSSSFPQYPYQQKPFHHIPILSKPAFVPSVYPSSFNPLYASSISNISPTFGFAPQRPIIPIAVPVSGLIKPNLVPLSFQGAFNELQPHFVRIPVPPHHHHFPTKDCAPTVPKQPSGNVVEFSNQWQPGMAPTRSSLIAYNPHAHFQKPAAIQNHQQQNQYSYNVEAYPHLNYDSPSSPYIGPSSYET